MVAAIWVRLGLHSLFSNGNEGILPLSTAISVCHGLRLFSPCAPDKSMGRWQCLPEPLRRATAQSEDNSSLILALSEQNVTPSARRDRRAAAAAARPHKSTQTLP